MKLVFIRHADPDYPNNTLTPKGFEEIKALKKYYKRSDYDDVYCSPLNRAILTCEAIKGMKKNYIIKDWLKEFYYPVEINGIVKHPWDFEEQFMDKHLDKLIDPKHCYELDFYQKTNIKEEYDSVVKEFDKILEEHGYVRENSYYVPVKPNDCTLLFVCHLGLMSVLLSHLFNTTYIHIAEYFAPSPCSITTLITEERKPGLAHFRLVTAGDVSHLIREGQKPSSSGRVNEYNKK